MTFDDLYKILLPKMAEKTTQREMKKAFELFDDDGSGFISIDHLRRISAELGEKMTDEELRVSAVFVFIFDKCEIVSGDDSRSRFVTSWHCD